MQVCRCGMARSKSVGRQSLSKLKLCYQISIKSVFKTEIGLVFEEEEEEQSIFGEIFVGFHLFFFFVFEKN